MIDQAKVEAYFQQSAAQTRDEFLAKLRNSYEASGRQNGAIRLHIAKVEKMTEAEFAVHNTKLIENCRAAAPELAKLAKQLARKIRR